MLRGQRKRRRGLSDLWKKRCWATFERLAKHFSQLDFRSSAPVASWAETSDDLPGSGEEGDAEARESATASRWLLDDTMELFRSASGGR